MDQVTRPRRSHVLLVIAFLLFKANVTSAYHVGDAVDTAVKYGPALDRLGVLRRQRPLFGKDSTADFEILSDREGAFTMTFEDGLWGLPTISLLTGANAASAESTSRRQLLSWTVYFVYSKSTGNGAIHKVTYSTPEYKLMNDNDEEARFSVHYKWIEEPEVNIEAGRTAMMAIVLIASVFIIVSSMHEESSPSGLTEAANGSSRSLPKHE